MCFIEIIKINHKTIKPVIGYEIYVTVKVVKSRPKLIVILKEQKGFRARVPVQNFWMR